MKILILAEVTSPATKSLSLYKENKKLHRGQTNGEVFLMIENWNNI